MRFFSGKSISGESISGKSFPAVSCPLNFFWRMFSHSFFRLHFISFPLSVTSHLFPTRMSSLSRSHVISIPLACHLYPARIESIPQPHLLYSPPASHLLPTRVSSLSRSRLIPSLFLFQVRSLDRRRSQGGASPVSPIGSASARSASNFLETIKWSLFTSCWHTA